MVRGGLSRKGFKAAVDDRCGHGRAGEVAISLEAFSLEQIEGLAQHQLSRSAGANPGRGRGQIGRGQAKGMRVELDRRRAFRPAVPWATVGAVQGVAAGREN